jgi:UDP-GlcNAc:undecaprenyl-phosphate GlcNAc-1-phosphate transferase
VKRGAAQAVAAGVVAAVAARAAYEALNRRPPAGEKTWTRTNHRGEPLTLLEGPAVALGAVAGALVAGGDARHTAAMALAGTAGAGLGCYDDLAGSGAHRGLRGHLSALARGEVTTGSVKLGGLGIAGLASAALIGGDAADVVINAGLIAGGANLLNLFDLRPGRAIKVATASAALIAGLAVRRTCHYGDTSYGHSALSAATGASLALLPEDLGERAMLGDTGANAIGAMLGAAAATALPRPARAGLLTGIAVLTAASEKVSFTKVITRTPWLNRLDMLGRRPPDVAPAPEAAAVPDAGGQDTGGPDARVGSGPRPAGQ